MLPAPRSPDGRTICQDQKTLADRGSTASIMPVTNPVESTFATVRLRTDKTKGCLSRATALALVFKLAKSAKRHWRRLNGSDRLAEIVRGVRFRDGDAVIAAEDQAAA
jgi:putative transposase